MGIVGKIIKQLLLLLIIKCSYAIFNIYIHIYNKKLFEASFLSGFVFIYTI